MPESAEMQAACAEMARIGPQHQSLARFAGTWRAAVKFWMDPNQPPHQSQGTMTSTLVLGGRFLRQDYRDDGGQFAGHGYWGYNPVDERFEGFWIDSVAACFQIEHGQHDPTTDTYTMLGSITEPATRKPMQKRSVIRYLGPNEHVVEMFFMGHAGRENKCMEIRYTRA